MIVIWHRLKSKNIPLETDAVVLQAIHLLLVEQQRAKQNPHTDRNKACGKDGSRLCEKGFCRHQDWTVRHHNAVINQLLGVFLTLSCVIH